MKEFLENLRQQVAENPPNYGDADSVLGLLYECFNENNPYDSEQIKADFEELYRQMNGDAPPGDGQNRLSGLQALPGS